MTSAFKMSQLATVFQVADVSRPSTSCSRDTGRSSSAAVRGLRWASDSPPAKPGINVAKNIRILSEPYPASCPKDVKSAMNIVAAAMSSPTSAEEISAGQAPNPYRRRRGNGIVALGWLVVVSLESHQSL